MSYEEREKMFAKDRETLKDLRKQSKKTLAEVANVLGVSVRAVSNYESGIRALNIMQIVPLARLYEVSAEEIIFAEEQSLIFRKS